MLYSQPHIIHIQQSLKDISTHAFYNDNDTCTSTLNTSHNGILIMTSDISPQAIISLSYDDWEEFVEALDIKKPIIVHDEELRRAIRAKT